MTQLIEIQITARHIQEMLADCDSGMCDLTRSNAMSRAMSEHLAEGEDLQVLWKLNRFLVKVGGREIALPEDASRWLRRALDGRLVSPADFVVPLPMQCLTEASAHEADLSSHRIAA